MADRLVFAHLAVRVRDCLGGGELIAALAPGNLRPGIQIDVPQFPILLHEEIARVALNNIQIYEGGRNQSVVLDGYKTVTKTPKETFLTGITYRKTSGTAPLTVRTAVPDTYLEPGDTVFAGNQELIASAITIAVGPRSSQMDVEA